MRIRAPEQLAGEPLRGHPGDGNPGMAQQEPQELGPHSRSRRQRQRAPRHAAWALALRILELLPRAGLTVLLPLAHARITRQEPRLLERQPELLVEPRERPGDAVADRARLARRAAATHGGDHVELADGVRHLERLCDDHAQRFTREVVLERASVDRDAPGAGADPHPGDRRLAPPGPIEPVEHCGHQRTSDLVDAGITTGCCAWWGWAAPR